MASRWGSPLAHPALVLLRDPSGKRSPFALFCTDPTVPMFQIVAWYVSRWNIEVTFLRSPRPSRPANTAAVEYACHRSDHSLPGSGLFSLVVLMAHALHPDQLPTRQAAWYPKAEPTKVSALAAVRRHLWAQLNSPTPPAALGPLNSTSSLFDMLVEVACYAA